jgi:predicted Co/Zn/Cd cation transporter (cation efflux family)
MLTGSPCYDNAFISRPSSKKKNEMDENNPEKRDEKGEGKTIDPIQLVFWGLLLVLYGAYGIYSSLKDLYEQNFQLVLYPYIVVLFFGMAVYYIGIKGERESRKKKSTEDSDIRLTR